jgi:biopolymer transport protein ExbD
VHFSRSYATVPLAALLLALILLIGLRRTPRPTTGFQVEVASDTCACRDLDDHFIVLHVSDGGRLSINSEDATPERLAALLSDIYRTRAEKILYLSIDDSASFQSIADALDIVQHLTEQSSGGVPVPDALRESTSKMDIRVRLVTRNATATVCRQGCVNWAKQGLRAVDRVRASDARFVPQ